MCELWTLSTYQTPIVLWKMVAGCGLLYIYPSHNFIHLSYTLIYSFPWWHFIQVNIYAQCFFSTYTLHTTKIKRVYWLTNSISKAIKIHKTEIIHNFFYCFLHLYHTIPQAPLVTLCVLDLGGPVFDVGHRRESFKKKKKKIRR